jgi:hypothetical protein
MSGEARKLEPGEVYQVYLTPQQHKLLQGALAKLPDDGYKRLKELVRKASTKYRPHNEMSRRERAQWIHDEILELESEVATIQEEMEGWASKQKGTTFSHTAQNNDVQESILTLRGIIQRLRGARDELKRLRFSGWNQPKVERWEKTHGPDSPLAKALEQKRTGDK